MTWKQAGLIAGALATGVAVGAVAVSGVSNAEAIIGLIGVLVGALIATGTTNLNAIQDRRHQLRLAALERRLQAHQEAYELWWKLRQSFYRDVEENIVLKAQDWWVRNCLYLDEEARRAFFRAYQGIGAMRVIAEPDLATKREIWSDLVSARAAIERGAGLPSIAEPEDSDVPSAAKLDDGKRL